MIRRRKDHDLVRTPIEVLEGKERERVFVKADLSITYLRGRETIG